MINSIMITNMIARTGRTIETIDNITEVPVSTVDIIGFPIPPVLTVDVSLVALDVPAMAAAVPPPAIMAKVQVISGLKPSRVETMINVPANAANGTATLSNKLSIYGIK